jgi:ribosomal protein S18 acetylase RimI-like enzyme
MMLALARATADGFRSLAVGVDSGSADDVGGAICWYSTSYVPLFNGAGLFDVDLFNEDTLVAISGYFKARERPYSLVTLDALVPDASERLRRLGCYELEASPAMWLGGMPNMWGEAPAGAWVSHVQTPSELQSYRDILSAVFGISEREINLIMSDKVLDVPYVRHYLGWLNGEPVATTSLVLAGDLAGIWNVGTLHEYRRQGAAAGLVRRAIADAIEAGYERSMLLSSPEGYRLYERLGYVTATTVRMFVPGR